MLYFKVKEFRSKYLKHKGVECFLWNIGFILYKVRMCFRFAVSDSTCSSVLNGKKKARRCYANMYSYDAYVFKNKVF